MKEQNFSDANVAGYGGSDYFCGALHIDEVSDKLAGNSGYFCTPTITIRFRPPCGRLMPPLPRQGVTQRESGTVFIFPQVKTF